MCDGIATIVIKPHDLPHRCVAPYRALSTFYSFMCFGGKTCKGISIMCRCFARTMTHHAAQPNVVVCRMRSEGNGQRSTARNLKGAARR